MSPGAGSLRDLKQRSFETKLHVTVTHSHHRCVQCNFLLEMASSRALNNSFVQSYPHLYIFASPPWLWYPLLLSASNLVFSFQLNKPSACVSTHLHWCHLIILQSQVQIGVSFHCHPYRHFIILTPFSTRFLGKGITNQRPHLWTHISLWTASWTVAPWQKLLCLVGMSSETDLVCKIFCVTVLSFSERISKELG